MKDNVIEIKSKAFALRIIKMYQVLSAERHEFNLSRQALRSGTSIGANVAEAVRGQSRADFFSKLNIALKEANETAYWLELLHGGGYLGDEEYSSVYSDCQEVICLLVSITKAQKA